MLQQALDREDVPAEAGMRDDLTEKLRQVEAQIEAQAKQAGPRQEAGPEEEAGPRPTTPTCTTPTCGAAESVAAAAEAEVSTAAGPSDQASSDQAPVARLLLELSDDLLLVCTPRAPHVHRTCTAYAHRICGRRRSYATVLHVPFMCTAGDPMPAGRG